MKKNAPKAWRPKAKSEIIGDYLGYELRQGKFGDYKIFMVRVASGEIKYASGVMINDLFCCLKPGVKVKLVCLGTVKIENTDREYKKYELYTEEQVELKVVLSA